MTSLKRTADIGQVEIILSGQGLVAHNLTTLLLNVKRRRKWRVAQLIADYVERPDCPLPLVTMHYNILLSACARRAPKRSLRLLEDMIARGVETNVVTHNTAMTAALALDDYEAALQIFENMRSARCPCPTPRPRSPPLLAARAWLSLVLAATLHSTRAARSRPCRPRSGLGIDPSTISYNTAIHACACARDAERAFALFREMEAGNVHRSAVTYTSLIRACGEGGQLDKAMALFTYMEVAGVERNVRHLRRDSPLRNRRLRRRLRVLRRL